MRRGPLAGQYIAVAAMVMLALIPYLALSAALGPLTPMIGEQLNMSAQTLSLSSGLANAAYAVGTVLAVQFAHAPPTAQDAGRLRGAARDRLDPRGLGAGTLDVHRRSRDPGPEHQPAPDRSGAAARDRLSGAQAARHRGHHEHVHLRRRGPRPVHRGAAGPGERVAAVVLDRRRDLPRGAWCWPY